MKWYADNSDFMSDGNINTPDVFVFGGIIVRDHTERALLDGVEVIRSKYAHRRAPIKWNFRDLKKVYVGEVREAYFGAMLASVDKWRPEMFELLAASDVQILVSAIEAFGEDKEKILGVRDQLAAHAYTNGLMRFGLHVAHNRGERAQVVVDWPDRKDPRPFNSEYDIAYQSGKTAMGVEYHCGPLHRLDFADHVNFATMEFCTLLQLADLVVGAAKDFFRCCLLGADQGRGLNMLKLVRNRIRGAPSPTDVLSRGLNVSTRNKPFRDAVGHALRTQLFA